MSSIPEINGLNFTSKVLHSKQPVLVAFLAPWSRPCQKLRSVLNEIATAFAGRVTVVTVNPDNHPDLGLWYEVHSIPTLLYFVGGTLRAKIVGTASKKAILAKLPPASHGKGSQSSTPPAGKENEHHNQ